jgi:glycine/D-amino acid oxidase-like deaminating enzyme
MLATLVRRFPDFRQNFQGCGAAWDKTGVRTMSPDNLPMIGSVPHLEKYLEHLGDLHHGRFGSQESDLSEFEQNELRMEGVYLYVGLGARGFTTASYGAGLLAAEICNENEGDSKGTLDRSLDPAQFILRWLKRPPELRTRFGLSRAQPDISPGAPGTGPS